MDRILDHMTEADVAAAVALIAAAMNPDEGRWAGEMFDFYFACQRHKMNAGRAYYVHKDGGTLIGLVGLHHYVWGPAENVWLSWFAVAPDRQRQGVGAAMLDAVTDIARAKGYRKFFIETYDGPDFAQARRFYTRMGFRQGGSIADYLPDNQTMIVFRKDL